MKNKLVNLDRPPLDSGEIQAGMNFGQLMVAYKGIPKPFYKSKWFFGTTGLATISIIAGTTLVMNQDEDVVVEMNTDSPPVLEVVKTPDAEPDETMLALNFVDNKQEEKLEERSKTKTKSKHDKITTQVASEKEKLKDVETNMDESIVVENVEKASFNMIDLSPRINGKLDGNITREELLDNKGLTTNADVSIIHFELHLIDGLGGKVFEEESNQINPEMKEALKNVRKGETIYFENIKGKTTDGAIVKLNPLRYVLQN